MNLRVDLPRIVIVHAAESQAVVDEQMPVGQVHHRHGRGKIGTEILAGAEIQFRVSRQMAGRIIVREARPVRDIGREKTLPRKISVEADIGRVALIVIQGEAAVRRRLEIRQSAVDGAEDLLYPQTEPRIADIGAKCGLKPGRRTFPQRMGPTRRKLDVA